MEGARGTIAVIGLGDLGLACARRLHDLGLEPVGVELDAQRREAWERETGLTGEERVVGRRIERAFVCVRTTEQAQATLAALREQAAGRELVAYVVTTLQPAAARQLGDQAGNGLRVIELPVSGGREGARQGTLSVLVGGDQTRPEDDALLDDTFAARRFAFPRFGDATLAKLVNNVAAGYNALAFARCLELAERGGLLAGRCAAVIQAGSGASWMAEHFAGLVDDLLAKDAGLLAAELGELPSIELSDPQAVVATLAQARERLT